MVSRLRAIRGYGESFSDLGLRLESTAVSWACWMRRSNNRAFLASRMADTHSGRGRMPFGP